MVELLAPAGTPDAFRAAIAAGADAVYVGLGAFNARAANGGFSLTELFAACALAHAHGARVYVTLNVYVRDDELDDAVGLAARALAAGADALIVADMGLISRIRSEFPEAELHLSTQAGAQCADAVRLAARELGVERVTCARELSVAELAELCDTGVEIEAFCHGAICICYSGACSYSALMRGRSANRGDCTQPCRLAYELQDGSGAVLAGGAWERGRAQGGPAMRPDGDRLLCPRDYLGIRHIAEMLEAGVSAFKVEGRMKGPDYVYNVVRCYREALDAALAGRPLDDAVIGELEARLARSFSRGFTSGYLEGGHVATGAGLMSLERAVNQGLCVGRVLEPRHEGALVALEREVTAGDMLEIRSTPGPDAPADVPKRWPIVPCPRDALSGEEVLVPCKRKVEAGSAVHMVRSAGAISEAESVVREMREEEARLVAAMPPAPSIDAGLDVRGAGPGRDGDAANASEGERGPVEPTRFAHARRRSAASRAPVALEAARHRDGLVVRTTGMVANGPAEGDADESLHAVLELGEVCRREDLEDVRAACDRVCRGGAPAVMVRNIGQIPAVRAAGAPWEAAPPLQVWNAETARVLLRLGARRVWLPEELTRWDLASVRAHCAGAAGGSTVEPAQDRRAAQCHAGDVVDIAAEGSTPLMVTEHCLLTAEGPCSNDCPTCPRRLASQAGGRFLLELDRKSSGARLAVRVDEKGRTRLYRA